jgi:hypothetical protein
MTDATKNPEVPVWEGTRARDIRALCVVLEAMLKEHPDAPYPPYLIHDLLNCADKWNSDFELQMRHRIRANKAEVSLAAMQARVEAVSAMARAEQLADKGQYDAAADEMWRVKFVEQAELAELAHTMAMGAPSRGDWDGFRVYFWKAWLRASEPPGEEGT